MFKKYKPSELFSYLGVTRDTLRYYEKKGLLTPKKNHDNNYRSYDIYDVYKIMIIDFYKKRGLSIQQIQSVLNQTEREELHTMLVHKIQELEDSIYEQQCMLKRIVETQEFSSELNKRINIFTEKTMPLYKVHSEVSDFIAVEEYENVLSISSNNTDMISKIMRYISFDEKGVISSKMCIVEQVNNRDEEGTYIHGSKCLYTVVEEIQSDTNQIDIMKQMHTASRNFANENGIKLVGEAYAIIRYITFEEQNIHTYIEIYIPFE